MHMHMYTASLAVLFVHRALTVPLLHACSLMRITCTGVHAHAHRICTALLAVLLVHRTFAARVPIHVHHMHSACMHMHMLICDWLGGRERVRPSPLP